VSETERGVELGLRLTGLALAAPLRPVLGATLALAAGLSSAAIRFKQQQRRGLDYGLRDALGMFCFVAYSVSGVASICFETEQLERVVSRLAPFGYFPAQEFPCIVLDLLRALLCVNQNRAECMEMMADVEARIEGPKLRSLLGDARYRAVCAGGLYMQGVMLSHAAGEAALERALRMDALDVRMFAMAADNVRLLFHSLRREVERARHYLARTEVFAVQGSTTWQAEMFLPALLVNGYMLCEDAVSVRRVWEQLTRRTGDAPELALYADAAHACYLVVGGVILLVDSRVHGRLTADTLAAVARLLREVST
jgi:hypothetical protein